MLTIFWDNPNTIGHDKTEVYRAESKNGEYKLVATLEPDETELTMSGLPKVNHVYYFRIDFLDEYMDTADSVVFPMGYFPIGTGPGPQELLRGNWELGYFGEVDIGSLPNFIEIAAAMGHGTVPTNAPNTWHKCIAQGNIIFVPSAALHNSSTFPGVVSSNTPVEDVTDDVIGLVMKDGYSFSARAPYLSANRRNQWTGFETEDLNTDSEAVSKSEIGAIIALNTNLPTALYGLPFKMGSEPAIDSFPYAIVTSTPANGSGVTGRSKSVWRLVGNPGTGSNAVIADGTYSVFVILELLFD